METKDKIALASLIISTLTFLFGSGVLKSHHTSSEDSSSASNMKTARVLQIGSFLVILVAIGVLLFDVNSTKTDPSSNATVETAYYGSSAGNRNPSPDPVHPAGNNNTTPLSSVRVGGSVYFGSYEQDNDLSNGQEPIEWIVLAKDGNSILLISRYCLDCRPFHSVSYEKVTWENCSLRSWLNDTFYDKAFDGNEKQMILSTMLNNNAGGSTRDKVFLLSIEEAETFFASNEDRVSTPTAYAFYQGCFAYNLATDTNHQCENSPYYESEWSSRYDPQAGAWWWLRSTGSDSGKAAGVRTVGSFNKNGNEVITGNDAVRPAVWVSWNE